VAEVHTEAGHDDNGNIEDVFGQTSVDDSGDSAISSPLTDSDLASPSAEEHRGGGGNGAVARSENFFNRMQKAVNLHLRDEMQQESTGDEAVSEMNRYIALFPRIEAPRPLLVQLCQTPGLYSRPGLY